MCAIFAASSGCSENTEEDMNVPEESAEDSEEESPDEDEEVKVEMESTGDSSNWCAVGSSWKSTNPQTGEEVEMKITGMETVDGIPMCKAVYETNIDDEDFSKIEYMWSENGETYFWTAYDKSGEVVSEMSMKDGKMKIVDEEGNVMEYSQGQ
ncbi:MAG: hypothetical protein AAGU10_01990 [Methanosarcina mazei]|jgi:hypothetical protein|uniref:Uncharacterized protein n=2 Tax=Methanosarcina mazei TaxID=2209 RepID=A0A0E3RKS7_METMZ|nr:MULTISPECIES: hypothetical protein [Methanosarcina]AKB66242.1 hypothetical protein MSMAS_3046 [Methanosarcina mazei S-6]AKB69584.1 hypothetical protein MSMAL_3041 [Methanosarcina mazei LYC]MDY0247058.1 hypothetical protein [Methanosarcina mazei]WIM44830.1 hypothetical protein PSF70_08635 [Methanosarcina mazei]WIM48290.1 hypothetical protein PQQ20_08600 [Methanosarcina mazei]